MKIEGYERAEDAEFWHGKALELAVKFLPGDAPLVKHIVSSYAKHHAPSQEGIPEGEEVGSKIKIIKPFSGVISNKACPIIKDLPGNDSNGTKLQPLDLEPNDYMTEFLEKINGPAN